MATIPDEQVRHDRAEPDRSDRSLVSLLKELRDETTTLMREEVTLAKTEMSEKINRVARNGGYLVAGSVVSFAGVMVLLLAATAGLYVGMIALDVEASIALWAAPLVVAAIVLVIGYAMVHKAINTLKHESAVPQRTVKTVQDDKNWIKEKVSR